MPVNQSCFCFDLLIPDFFPARKTSGEYSLNNEVCFDQSNQNSCWHELCAFKSEFDNHNHESSFLPDGKIWQPRVLLSLWGERENAKWFCQGQMKITGWSRHQNLTQHSGWQDSNFCQTQRPRKPPPRFGHSALNIVCRKKVSLLCEVHLWSEHWAVTAGRPFCGSDKNCIPDLWSHLDLGPPLHLRSPEAIWATYSVHIWEVGWMSQTSCHTWTWEEM